MSAVEGRIPSFFIAGAPKSGTTALYSYLREHPGIFIPELKEPHFFSTDLPGLRVVEEPAAYRRLFRDAPPGALVGEASASYLMSEEAIPRILELRRSARFLVMVRNPVEMAHAFHAELVYNLSEDVEDFEEAWSLQDVRAEGRRIPPRCREPTLLQYRQVCAVGDQLERLMDRVPDERRQVILFDDFIADPGAAYRRALSFLELPDDGRAEFPRVNPSKAVRSRGLAALHRSLPRLLGPLYGPLKALGNHLGLWPSELMERHNVVERERSPLDPGFRRRLQDEFEGQVRTVARILDRDLSHWLDGEAGGSRRRGRS